MDILPCAPAPKNFLSRPHKVAHMRCSSILWLLDWTVATPSQNRPVCGLRPPDEDSICSHRGIALLKDDPAAHIFTHGRLLAWQRLMKSTMPDRATTVVGSIFSRCSVAMAV